MPTETPYLAKIRARGDSHPLGRRRLVSCYTPCAMQISSAIPGALTSCQQTAMEKLERQGNIFLTGAAGTGKSFLLDRYLADKPAASFPIVASTGAAAVLIGGRTFHGFFGLGIMEGGADAAVARALKNRKLIHRLAMAHCIVIDEVSMLSGITLEAAERIARRARQRDEPWGGLRIIVVGDFAQLPPVTQGGQAKDWAFLHAVWRESEFHPALLSTVMRTQDSDFLAILNFIRAGVVNDEVRGFLDARMAPGARQSEGTRLYAHRVRAEDYNLRRLEAIPGQARSFETRYEGDDRYIDTAKRAFPVPEELHLKEGALVMMRKNDVSGERLYVNGSLGHVRQIDADLLHVRLLTGETLEVEPCKFSYLDGDGRELLAAWNFPVTLAWATTIHKAQGASLDRMTVDLSSLWEPGQAYVALSRVRSANGLSIERWSPGSIRAEPLVTELYDSLAVASQSYVPRPFFTLPDPQYYQAEEAAMSQQEGGVRERRAALIREHIGKESPLERIVEEAGVKTDRVLLYMEEFLKEGTAVRIGYLIADLPEASRIRQAFEELGTERLKPVFEALGESIPFTTLRLVRCVMMAEAGA